MAAEALGRPEGTPAELDADRDFLARVEAIRLKAGRLMGMGDVSKMVVPKPVLASRPARAGGIASRYFTPHACHRSHAATGALAVGTAAALRKRREPLVDPAGFSGGPLRIEHPAGAIPVDLELAAEAKSSVPRWCAPRGDSSRAACSFPSRRSPDTLTLALVPRRRISMNRALSSSPRSRSLRRARADLSDQAGQARRAVRARRHLGGRRPAGRGGDVERPRPADDRREQGRRRGKHRDGRGRARRTRRLHADPRPLRHARGQPVHVRRSCRTTPTRTSRRSRCSPRCRTSTSSTRPCRRKNLKEFVALAKAKPGQLNYGSAGNGSAGHLAFEYLKLSPASTSCTCRTRAPARRSPT